MWNWANQGCPTLMLSFENTLVELFTHFKKSGGQSTILLYLTVTGDPSIFRMETVMIANSITEAVH